MSKYVMRMPMVAADNANQDLYTKIIEEHNKYRERPLFESNFLNAVADIRCADLINEHYFAHTDPNNSPGKWNQVMLTLGAKTWNLSGENLWMGQNWSVDKIPQGVVQGFMDSPLHRENVLEPSYDAIGVAIQFRPDIGWDVAVCIYAGGLIL